MAAYWFYIHEGHIAGFTQPGGEVSDMVSALARRTKWIAKGLAPKRTGRMAEFISHSNAKPRGPYSCAARAESPVRYSSWVHEGTGDYVGGAYRMVPLMKFPAPQTPKVPRRTVRGQTANPFLRRALAQAMDEFRGGAVG